MGRKKNKALKYLQKRLKKDLGLVSLMSSELSEYIDDTTANKINADLYIPDCNTLIKIVKQDYSKNINESSLGYTLLYLNSTNIKTSYKSIKLFLSELINERENAPLINQIKAVDHSSKQEIKLVNGGYKANEERTYSAPEIKDLQQADVEDQVQKLEEQLNARQEINDLIGNSPGWLLRSGISLTFFVVAILIAFTTIVKYPDKITCQGSITSSHAPVPILPRANGKIEEIYVTNGQTVQEGDKLLYIHNSVNRSHLNTLMNFIHRCEQFDMGHDVQFLRLPKKLDIGEMQSLYSTLQLKFLEYVQVLRMTGVDKQLEAIKREIDKIKDLNVFLQKEDIIYKQELVLIEKTYNRNKELYNEGVVSLQDLENSEQRLRTYQRSKESMNKNIIQNNIRIESQTLESEKLKERRNAELNSYRFSIYELISQLRSSISVWEDNYIVTAEVSGKVELPNSLNENNPVSVMQAVGYIVRSEEKSDIKELIAYVPSRGFGKIKSGDKALIKVDAYPHKEYGSLISHVNDISQVGYKVTDIGKIYEISIPIDSILVTDLGKRINYAPELTAIVDIITEDKSLLSRILDQFISLINNHTSYETDR